MSFIYNFISLILRKKLLNEISKKNIYLYLKTCIVFYCKTKLILNFFKSFFKVMTVCKISIINTCLSSYELIKNIIT